MPFLPQKNRYGKGGTMRSLKFRIWDGQKNEWLGATDNDVLTYYGFHLVGEVMTVQAPPQWALDPHCVVEQYTGLKDQNGKEIYEGDIIQCHLSPISSTIFTGVVEFRPGCIMFKNFADGGAYAFNFLGSIEAVIGNIHESNMEELCQKK